MNLLRIEFRKILPYKTVWVILAIYVVLMVLVLNASSGITINGRQLGADAFQLPGVWQRLSFLASFFNLLLGILIIVLVSDEYSFRTLRQQVIDGLSRVEIVLAKFYVILAVAAFSTIFLLLLGLYFSLLYSTDHSVDAFFSQIDHLSYYFVQAVAYMALAMLFAFLIKKSGLAIIAFIAYAKIVEPLVHLRIPDTVDKYMPMKALGSLTPMPGQDLIDQFTTPTEQLTPPWAAVAGLFYIGLFLFLSYSLLKVRDL
ncbi:ABC transporter permease subunit [Pontibacter harenae]|uniref:ABC transporter permease subunit n=1 Tax=Pontibacter harenae TaxID=2894083 RepID=UPI001E56911B|nr:ABC transporter permease subunit [Pontibacter harenae]MCC9166176.1 ABC transporter permease [Pontibacter harenae]